MQKEVYVKGGRVVLDVFSAPRVGKETIVHRTTFEGDEGVSLDKLNAMASHAETVISQHLSIYP